MELRIKKIPKFWDFLNNSKHRINVLYGGAGSGKSYQIALFLLFQKFLREKDISILIVRKTMPSLRISAYKLIMGFINRYGLLNICNIDHQKTVSTLVFNHNEINFMGIDDPEKIKSAEWNYIWIEEATDLTLDDYRQLNLRLRRKTDKINQMYLSLNPISSYHWINTELLEKRDPDVLSMQSTYKDNPFLSNEYINELEKLKDQDYTLYQIYAEGIWGILKNLVYTRYDVIDQFPEVFDEVIYGMDFGFVNQSAIIKIGIFEDCFYLQELLYETNLTSTLLVNRMSQLPINRNSYIYGDSNRTDYIDEIFKAGYNIRGAEKGVGSVINGIDTVKKCKLYIHSGSLNLLKEIRSYKLKENSQGVVIDEPVKFNDHLMDAMRYAIMDYLGNQHGAAIELW